MAQPTIALTTGELRIEVAGYCGFSTTTYASLTTSEAADVDRFIMRGLRRFYAPPPLPGEPTSHLWSFLQPTATITTSSGTEAYALPDDFGGMIGPTLTWAADSNRPAVQIVPQSAYAETKQVPYQPSTYPRIATILPVATVATGNPDIPTRFKVYLYPTPAETATLTYRYYVTQDVVTGSIDPPGSQWHGETIIAACLSVQEETINPRETVWRERWMQQLAASVAFDRRMAAPQTFGRNLDRSDISDWTPWQKTGTVTVYGSTYP